MGLTLEKVDKIVGQEVYLKDIDLHFEPGSRNVLLGRTLAGKTSLLRILAGLDRPTRGRLLLKGKDYTGVSVRKRSVAMVYQQFINYPSMTVYDNIASPLKLAKLDRAEIDRKVRQAAEMLHIENFFDRLPAELSGGQQQRTAIARALVKDAELLLLDEPLVNLDYKLREELRVELQAIFERRESIVVYTTTEPAEALMMGGNIVVLDEGRVLQTGATPEVYHHPATLKVAEVFSDPPINYMQGRVAGKQAEMGEGIQFPLRGHLAELSKAASGTAYMFGIRCNHLFLERQHPEDIELAAKVVLSEINGSETFIHVAHGDVNLVVQDEGIRPVKIGSSLSVFIHPGRLFVYDDSGHLVASPDQATQ